jgi:Fe(3+) dicitrate transport protein
MIGRRTYSLLAMLLLAGSLAAQDLRGTITHQGQGVPHVQVQITPGTHATHTNAQGEFTFRSLGPGKFHLLANSPQLFQPIATDVELVADQDIALELTVDSLNYILGAIEIVDEASSVNWMRSVDGMGIYAARKCELINIEQVTANLATNNARQVFNRVAGLNIWENDGGGLQLGIGGRGLSPNRSSNFNTRQNGYDIAADALGYPESYYSPPIEALQRIEVVRGAASLQYGTQFGGMVNFMFKEGPKDKKIQLTSRQTLGSYGFFSSFNSLGGQVGKLNYYAFYQGKRGDGWRENSGFQQHTAYGSLRWQLSPKVKLGAEYTYMHYLAQQPGGLTDGMFVRDPRQSIRDRNWFQVDWNLAAVTADIALAKSTRLNVRNFGLYARRDALGYLGAINRIDPGGNRDLISGSFQNFGNETRLMHKFDIRQKPAALLVGARYYQGYTTAQQGAATDGDGPDFQLLNPEQPEGSDYAFPSRNIAAFAEQLLHLNSKWILAPGLRYEYVRTASEGTYQVRNTDLAGNVIYEATVTDNRSRDRNIFLAGLGTSFKPQDDLECYANISRNYRAITFNDMRVTNPNFEIDPTLKDEKGFNADLGFRGRVGKWLTLDASAFYLYYQDRIGQVLKTDTTTFRYYRYRTNVSDSRNIGLECYGEADLLQVLHMTAPATRLALFGNVAWIDARYISSEISAFDGNRVELVPKINLKTGLDFKHKNLRANVQWTYVAQQYSDATNAETSPNAVEGLIPAYHVLDASAGYAWKWLSLEASCNNVLNQMYFTRRAAAYPGPGIIPSDGRSFFVTLQVKI